MRSGERRVEGGEGGGVVLIKGFAHGCGIELEGHPCDSPMSRCLLNIKLGMLCF